MAELLEKIIIGIVKVLVLFWIVYKNPYINKYINEIPTKRNKKTKSTKKVKKVKKEGYFIIPEKWREFGIVNDQCFMDAIDEAFSNKEKLDSNIYIGNTKFCNFCLCLTEDGKLEYAFPVKTTKEEYFDIKSKVKKIGLGSELSEEVISLLIAIDLKNYKDELIDNINKNDVSYTFDLFTIYVGDDVISFIDVGKGKIFCNTKIIRNYILNNYIGLE